MTGAPLRILVAVDEADLAINELVAGLLAGGHRVAVLSVVPGSQDQELREAGAAVHHDAPVDDSFDVIHAAHPALAVLARARFPQTPMVLDTRGGPDEMPSVDAHVQVVLAPDGPRDAAWLEGQYRSAIQAFEPRPVALPAREIEMLVRALRRSSQKRAGDLDRMREALDARAMELDMREATLRQPELHPYWKGAIDVDRVVELDRRARTLQRFHDQVTASASYRALRALRKPIDRLFPWGTTRRSFLLAPLRATVLIRDEGFLSFLRNLGTALPKLLQPAIPPPHTEERYQVWERLRYRRRNVRAMRRRMASLEYTPVISIVMPVYNSKPEWLMTAMRSIRRQVYPHWELCIADDASTSADTRAALRRLQGDPRVKVRVLQQNTGISGASNAALALATGEFVGLMDHDDELKPDALLEVVSLLNREPDLDYIYSDEDKRAADGRLVDVFFKPDWSPDLLLSLNYASHFSVFRRSIIHQAGGFRPEFDGSQDYDLVLRVTEATDRIAHIPVPLYTWRVVPGSAAGTDEAKPWAYSAARRALEEALVRRGVAGSVSFGPFTGSYQVSYEIKQPPHVVAMIDGVREPEGVVECVQTLRSRTSYPSLEIDAIMTHDPGPDLEGVDVVYADPSSTFGARMNRAARDRGEDSLLLFLDGAIRVLDASWLGAMAQHAVRDEVGVVGARLLLPDGARAHEGLVVGLDKIVATGSLAPHFRLGDVIRNCSAVDGACLVMRSETFWELGGFDEDLGMLEASIDLCLRAREKGYLVVYTPLATLGLDPRVPLEGDSSSFGTTLASRWAGYKDPYYNPNLDRADPYSVSV